MNRCVLLRTKGAAGAVGQFPRRRGTLKSAQRRLQSTSRDSSYVPRIAQPSFWDSVIPRAWRNRSKTAGVETSDKTSKPTNPATYFIWMSLLIGSQAMRLISIQTEHRTFIRKAELKIDQLRQVVDKLQRGEEVDVEKVLGTGDEAQELDWEQALEEIKNEEMLWQINKKRLREEKARREAEGRDASPVNEEAIDKMDGDQAPVPAQPGFY